jgi:hypothetical protein
LPRALRGVRGRISAAALALGTAAVCVVPPIAQEHGYNLKLFGGDWRAPERFGLEASSLDDSYVGPPISDIDWSAVRLNGGSSLDVNDDPLFTPGSVPFRF